MRTAWTRMLLLGGQLVAAACSGDASAPAPGDARALRIAVMAPAAAEMLDELRCLDRVVAVGDYVSEPATLAGLPRIGGYDAPNIERLLSLEVDLMLTARSEAATPAHARLETLGIAVAALDTSTFEGVFDSLLHLGGLVGQASRARDSVARMRAEIELVRRAAVGLPRRRVLVVVGRDPLFVAGPGSHLDEMIRIVGAENVAADLDAPYGRISLESVLERLPEVILDTSDNHRAALRGRVAGAWGRWGFLPAVEHDEVHLLDPTLLVIPGMRLPEMQRRVARLVQPQAFGEALASDYTPRPAGSS